MHHTLKMHAEYFAHAWNGYKPFEIRLNDRNYKTGDTVLLVEYDPAIKFYCGPSIYGRITVIFENAIGVQPGYVLFLYDEISRHRALVDTVSLKLALEEAKEHSVTPPSDMLVSGLFNEEKGG